MDLLILKNGEIFSRLVVENDGADYSFAVLTDVPAMPTTPAGKGKYWELDYVDGVLAWTAKDRPLTAEERMAMVEDRLNAIEYPEFVQPTGAHDAYAKGAKVTYNGMRYVSLIEGNVWNPVDYPDGWEAVN